MKTILSTLVTGLLIFLLVALFHFVVMWIDLSTKYKQMEKELYNVKVELYQYHTDVETYRDIIVNKRW